jgi:hypothetical protein
MIRNYGEISPMKLVRQMRMIEAPLAVAAIASLLILGSSVITCAQTTDAKLQAETNALNAQMRSLESKMPSLEGSKPPIPGVKDPASETSIFADKKLHLGGITITPGGFIEAGGLRRQY